MKKSTVKQKSQPIFHVRIVTSSTISQTFLQQVKKIKPKLKYDLATLQSYQAQVNSVYMLQMHQLISPKTRCIVIDKILRRLQTHLILKNNLIKVSK